MNTKNKKYIICREDRQTGKETYLRIKIFDECGEILDSFADWSTKTKKAEKFKSFLQAKLVLSLLPEDNHVYSIFSTQWVKEK